MVTPLVRLECSLISCASLVFKSLMSDRIDAGTLCQKQMFCHTYTSEQSGGSIYSLPGCLHAGMTTQCQWRLLAARGLLAPLQLRHCSWASSSPVSNSSHFASVAQDCQQQSRPHTSLCQLCSACSRLPAVVSSLHKVTCWCPLSVSSI